MRLMHMGLVNWHLFPLLDVSFDGPVLGISGENKSGKSTLLDAIQTVMTGCDQRQMELNRVAAEKGSRGTHRRSVQAYCLGRLSSDSDGVIRQASNTCLLMVYRDPKGEKPSVTLGVALEARVSDNNVTVSSRFMAVGCELKATDIVVPAPGGGFVAHPWGENRRRVQALVEAAGGQFYEYRDTAKEFVREYTYLLFARGKSSMPGPQYIRNLINAITFKEMSSANEFVSTYLLEDDPIQVASLRRSIQVYRDAAKQVEDLSNNLVSLKILIGLLDELRDQREAHARASWIALRAKISWAVALFLEKRREAEKLKAQLEDKQRLERQCDAEIERIRDGLEEVRARKRAALSMDRQETLKKELEILDRQLADVRRPVVGPSGGGQVVTNLKIVAEVPEVKEAHRDLGRLVKEVSTLLPGGLDKYEMARNPERLDAICEQIGDMVASLGLITGRRHAAKAAAESRLDEEQAELVRTLNDTRSGRITLSANVEAMLQRLRKAGMAPRVLCEMVDIDDDDWRNAAEGFLGADREAIFVDPEHCHAAIDIRSEERGTFRGVRIANTRKLKTMDHRPERGTLASVFKGADQLAMAYIVHRTGRVNLAESTMDFDRRGRWILSNGTYDDGVAIDVKEPGVLKIGSRALASAEAAAVLRLNEITAEIEKARHASIMASRDSGSVRQFAEWFAKHAGENGKCDAFASAASEAAEIAFKRGVAQEEIDRLASADVSEIDAEIALLDGAKNESEREFKALKSEIEKLVGGLGAANHILEAGNLTPGSKMHAKGTRDQSRIAMRKHQIAEPIKAYVARRAQFKSAAELEKRSLLDADAAAVKALDLESICAEDARICLAALKQSDLFGLKPNLEREIRPWAQEQVDEIENETLVGYRRDLEEARAKTNDIFRNSFVNELIARFSKVDEELREIRDVLKRYSFLNERYKFKSNRAPGYEAFHRIVDRQKELEVNNVQLFKGDIDDSNPFAEDLRAVENVLLAENVDIETYEDYRRYFIFELEITDVTSNRTVAWSARKGTASGGETQTPYYVALLSALSSIYYGGARARNEEDLDGLCIAAFDEAFSKLDEKVRYQMVQFSQDLGLQLLICGPDGGRQSMERYAHTIVDVWRSGDQSFAMADQIKERTRQELAEIDPSRMTREEVEQSLIAAE